MRKQKASFWNFCGRIAWGLLRWAWRRLTQNMVGPGEKPTKEALDLFYKSKKWKKLALATKVKRGFRCECCGFTPQASWKPKWLRRWAEDSNYIVTDHIKSVKNHWDLRLDPRNLQVLCNNCNLGKGSNNYTDFSKFKTGWLDRRRVKDELWAAAQNKQKIGSKDYSL